MDRHAAFHDYVVGHVLAWRTAGVGAALVTLVNVDGSSPRPIGSQMAVGADGRHVGAISSGCAQAAIIAQAVAAIKSGQRSCVRYGAGSQFIDIALPCGSGIDVHVEPGLSLATLTALDEARLARQPATLVLESVPTGGGAYTKHYHPPVKLVVAGRGAMVECVVGLAQLLAWDLEVASPDPVTLAHAQGLGAVVQALTTPDAFDAGGIDAATAVVVLFHDHDWEPPILARCESTLAFYVGALGSRRTHAVRTDLLAQLGCSSAFIASLHSPIGLDIGAVSPPEIAVAIIAEIVAAASRPRSLSKPVA